MRGSVLNAEGIFVVQASHGLHQPKHPCHIRIPTVAALCSHPNALLLVLHKQQLMLVCLTSKGTASMRLRTVSAPP